MQKCSCYGIDRYKERHSEDLKDKLFPFFLFEKPKKQIKNNDNTYFLIDNIINI